MQTFIKGFIYDQETKEPLIGASVFIEETSVGTASDVDGSYSISNIRSCTTCRYTLKATYIGYKTFSKSVSVLKIKSDDIGPLIQNNSFGCSIKWK